MVLPGSRIYRRLWDCDEAKLPRVFTTGGVDAAVLHSTRARARSVRAGHAAVRVGPRRGWPDANKLPKQQGQSRSVDSSSNLAAQAKLEIL